MATPFLLLAPFAISLTLWVSWRLDGVRLPRQRGRSRACRRIACRCSAQAANDPVSLRAHISGSSSAASNCCANGDPERPLFVPWDEQVIEPWMPVETFRGSVPANHIDDRESALWATTASFVQHFDGLVVAIERHMSRWTAMLHLPQLATMALAVLVLRRCSTPGICLCWNRLGSSSRATEQIQRGDDLGARVSAVATTNSQRWPAASMACRTSRVDVPQP